MSNIPNEDFSWLNVCAPCFNVDGNNIEVLTEPEQFYKTLLEESKTAKKRIVLAALYLGTDECEKALVEALSHALQNQENENLQVDILLDYVRGSRGELNSRTMLLPLLKEKNKNVNIALYHTPMLRGMLKKILPNRWNETIGLAHLKAFVFDDTLVLSGANLSNDYFKNRQDRYMVFRNCKELSDYFHKLVKTVGKFSFQLKEDDSILLADGWKHHPYDGDLDAFVKDAHDEVKNLISQTMKKNNVEESTLNHCCNLDKVQEGFWQKVFTKSQSFCGYAYDTLTWKTKETDNYNENEALINDLKLKSGNLLNFGGGITGTNDTWVYPIIQMGNIGICQDQFITETLMKSFSSKSHISFTSGYFNVTDGYCDLLLNTPANYDILLASPEANGFLGAKGFAGYIPAVYVYLARKFYNQAKDVGRLDKLSLWEYIRPGWTFHGKGLWCYLPQEQHPSLTLIGSPNFGSRSVTRDLEAQAVVFTKNKQLQKQLHLEQENLSKYSQKITQETFKQDRYLVPRWVILVTQLIKRYF